MLNIGEKLDNIIKLSPEEKLLIFGPEQSKHTKFDLHLGDVADDTLLLVSDLETHTITHVLSEAIHHIDFFTVQFPKHDEPPARMFDYTLDGFIHRRSIDQWTYELYQKFNSVDIQNMAKLYIEFEKCRSSLTNLIDALKNRKCFKTLQHTIFKMRELEHFLVNLDKENEENIALLRRRETELIKLLRIKVAPPNEVKKLDHDYIMLQHEYHDARLIAARQLRYNKNLFSAQMEQINRREMYKSGDLVDELNELSRMCEQEILVFEESTKFNLIMINEFKEKVVKMSHKYENDLIETEIKISRAKSEFNVFEECWKLKMAEMDFMKSVSDQYVESVRQRKIEAIIKRLSKPWLDSVRKTLAERKRKAIRLAKKNKQKKKR